MFINFADDRRGTVSAVFAGILIPSLALVGASVDYARALKAKTHLQAAADAAASAGARLPATANQNRMDAALKVFNANAANSEIQGSSPTVNANNSEVTVSASLDVRAAFLGLVGFKTLTVNASSTARSQIENGGVACLVALSESSEDGLHLQGINKVSSENCWAWINSTHATAINADGASSGTAQGFCTAGGVDGAEHFHPTPYTECSPMADPFYEKFANYSVPTACDHTDLRLNNGTHTLNPGVYCGDTVLKPQAIVTFNPGLYVMKGGIFQVQAGAEATGDGVTFFFYGPDTKLDVRGGASIEFKAPTTGDLASFVFVDRKLDWYDPSVRESTIQGGGRLKVEGIIYAPQWKVNISGNGELNDEATFFTMIADTFYMEGNGRLHVKSDAAAAGFPEVMPKIKTGPVILK